MSHAWHVRNGLVVQVYWTSYFGTFLFGIGSQSRPTSKLRETRSAVGSIIVQRTQIEEALCEHGSTLTSNEANLTCVNDCSTRQSAAHLGPHSGALSIIELSPRPNLSVTLTARLSCSASFVVLST